MTNLVLLALFQLVLLLCMLAIVSKLIGMIKAGAPLVSLQRPSLPKPAGSPKIKSVGSPIRKNANEPEASGRMVSFQLPIPGRARGDAQEAATTPAEVPPVGRSRRLLTLSELEAASNRAAAHFPENYYAEVEGRLEGLFQDYLSHSITLADYLEKVRKERSLTQAVLRNGNVLIDPQLRSEAERAAAAIDWCLQWAGEQVAQKPDGLAA